ELNALFESCFCIQREASEAAGRYIPMVVENVKGAQPWVGPAKAHYGSFYLWGDVAMVGNRVVAGVPQFGGGVKAGKTRGDKVPMNFHEFENTGKPGRSFQSVAVASNGTKVPGNDTFKKTGKPCNKLTDPRYGSGVKQPGHSGRKWFADSDVAGSLSSKSPARKAASAMIAKIPLALARYVARGLKPSGF
ncbi:MAG: hypothetical protein ABR987_16685, partial [Terracidiphilus sp.]